MKFHNDDCTEHNPILRPIFHMHKSSWSFCQKYIYLCTPKQKDINSALYL